CSGLDTLFFDHSIQYKETHMSSLSALMTRHASVACLVLWSSITHAGEVPLTQSDWEKIKEIAYDFVTKESPNSVWPFDRQFRAKPGSYKHQLVAHYFPPLPLSLDNKPAAEDYWTAEYLRRSGEGNKYYRQGGYTRQRPLPVGPWPSRYWREINAAI